MVENNLYMHHYCHKKETKKHHQISMRQDRVIFQLPDEEPLKLKWEEKCEEVKALPEAIKTLFLSKQFFCRFKQLKKQEHIDAFDKLLREA